VRDVEKPRRPGAQPFGSQLRHALAILLGGGLAIGAALAHHIDAQGGMRHLGRHVDIVGTAAIASRKSGKLCQFHGRPSLSTTSGMSSTPSIRFISMSC